MEEPCHTCICLCEKCERLGLGAFGVQPDGAEPLQLEAARPEVLPVGTFQAAPSRQRCDEQRL